MALGGKRLAGSASNQDLSFRFSEQAADLLAAQFGYVAFEKDGAVVAFEWITAGRVYIHASLYLKAFQYEPVAQAANAAENLDYACALYCVWNSGCTSVVSLGSDRCFIRQHTDLYRRNQLVDGALNICASVLRRVRPPS